LIIQGQSSSGSVGSDQLQTNAATVVLRRLAKDFDDDVTVPHLEDYYSWIREMEVLHTSEAVVHARGSSVLVERDLQAQALIQMVQLSRDPSYGQDPKLVMEEWMRTQRMDPAKTRLSADREQQLMAAMQKPDEKAQAAVQSANIRADALTKQAETEAGVNIEDLKLQFADRERNRQHQKEMQDRKYKAELISYALKKNLDIDEHVRKMIADTFVEQGKPEQEML